MTSESRLDAIRTYIAKDAFADFLGAEVQIPEPGRSRVLGTTPPSTFALVRLLPVSSWHDEKSARHLYRMLGRIVRGSGGRIVTVGSVAGIERAFTEILAELREQYALGYYPDPRRNDGSWRQVKVELAKRGLKLRTREGYVDR